VNLSPQDVVVVLKSLIDGSERAAQQQAKDAAEEMEAKFLATACKSSTYAELGEELAMSPSQVFRSVVRAEEARLLYRLPVKPAPGHTKDQTRFWPYRENLKEFLIHGVKYAFPVHHGGLVRGIPTAHAAPPLSQQIAKSSEPPPVWPDPEGTVRGLEFSRCTRMYRQQLGAIRNSMNSWHWWMQFEMAGCASERLQSAN